MALHHNHRIVTDGLVLALDAGDVNSYPGTGTTWYDLSGNGNNGTLTNGPSFQSTNQGIIEFDGTNDYVNVANSDTLDGFSSVTFEAWVNPDNSASYRRIFDKNYNNSYNFSLANNNTFYIYINGSFSNSNTTVNPDEWQLLTATYNGTSAIFYKNGSIVQTNAFAHGAVGTNSDDLRIGTNYNSTTSQFNGHIGLCKIYSKELTASEVLQNYNATKTRFGL